MKEKKMKLEFFSRYRRSFVGEEIEITHYSVIESCILCSEIPEATMSLSDDENVKPVDENGTRDKKPPYPCDDTQKQSVNDPDKEL